MNEIRAEAAVQTGEGRSRGEDGCRGTNLHLLVRLHAFLMFWMLILPVQVTRRRYSHLKARARAFPSRSIKAVKTLLTAQPMRAPSRPPSRYPQNAEIASERICVPPRVAALSAFKNLSYPFATTITSGGGILDVLTGPPGHGKGERMCQSPLSQLGVRCNMRCRIWPGLAGAHTQALSRSLPAVFKLMRYCRRGRNAVTLPCT